MSSTAGANGSVTSATELARALRRGAVQCFGERVSLERFRPLSGGASASTWELDAIVDGRVHALIVQLARGNRFTGSLTKAQQGAVQQYAFENGVPTPRVRWLLAPEDGVGEGYVSERIAGETLGKRIVSDPALAGARAAMTRQCATILADIHRLDTAAVTFLPTDTPRNLVAALATQHRAYGERLPVFDLSLRWLDRHAPARSELRVVHGDFRTGNFIVNEQGIAAVLDWELGHLGDPMEDLGWLCMNAWRFGQIDAPVGGFGGREELYSAYQEASGRRVDVAAVHFWEIYGALKWGVICQYFAFQHLSGAARSLERAAIGRRLSETEFDILHLLEHARWP